jgi:aspartyl-tRNA(Asn)/glutamyl-tRNA(Gln) amidotransferase subunit A
VLLTLVLPAHKHGIGEFVVNGDTVDLTSLQGATVPLTVTGLPGLPINMQLVGSWQAETTLAA